jgi:hypothetical protein
MNAPLTVVDGNRRLPPQARQNAYGATMNKD